MKLDNDIKKVLYSNEQLKERISEVAKEISDYYEDQELYVVGLLKGSVNFLTYLTERIDNKITIDYIKCSSYAGTSSTGNVKIDLDLSYDIHGKNVLLVEDIIDTGLTVKCIKEVLLSRGANSVKVVSLLNKPSRREQPISPDWSCFECPNEFIVGFGLDFNQKYRNLPYVGVLKEELYSK